MLEFTMNNPSNGIAYTCEYFLYRIQYLDAKCQDTLVRRIWRCSNAKHYDIMTWIPLLGGVDSVAHFITVNEQSQSNLDCNFLFSTASFTSGRSYNQNLFNFVFVIFNFLPRPQRNAKTVVICKLCVQQNVGPHLRPKCFLFYIVVYQ